MIVSAEQWYCRNTFSRTPILVKHLPVAASFIWIPLSWVVTCDVINNLSGDFENGCCHKPSKVVLCRANFLYFLHSACSFQRTKTRIENYGSICRNCITKLDKKALYFYGFLNSTLINNGAAVGREWISTQ